MNWPIWLFAVTMVGLFAGFVVSKKAPFIPAMALTVYLAVDFSLWTVLKWGFWISVILALIFVVLTKRKLVIVFGSIALAISVGAASFGTWSWDESRFGDDNAAVAGEQSTTTSTSTTAPPVVQDTGLSDQDEQGVAKYLAEIYEGYMPEEVNVGGNGNIPDSPEERSPTASFTKETIENREDLVAFFASDHPNAQSARARVERSLRAAGYGDDEVNQALTSGDRWIWVSPTVESQILGTTYPLNGDIVKAENWRQVAPNDAIWFYVTSDAKLVKGAAVRADCGNPEVDKVRPVRPETPEVPPVEIPPGEKCPFNPALPVDSPDCKKDKEMCPYNPALPVDSPMCLKPKDPDDSTNNNPDIPEGARKTEPSPDNQSEIDEGPTQPVDSPTGCAGPCPTSTTTTTSPSSGGGTTPACGEAGQPACSGTGQSPPTTVAPQPDGDPNSDPDNPNNGTVPSD